MGVGGSVVGVHLWLLRVHHSLLRLLHGVVTTVWILLLLLRRELLGLLWFRWLRWLLWLLLRHLGWQPMLLALLRHELELFRGRLFTVINGTLVIEIS